jgi:hypothetical protein
MNAHYFIALFVVLVLVATTFTIQKKENFQVQKPLTPKLRMVESPVQQKNLDDVLQAYTYPSDTLLSPSPGQIGSFNSLPYQDPSLEKAPYQRILSVQTNLQSFLDKESSSLSDLSDPAVVLPLTTARSDLVRLRNEIMVLKRNQGINSSLTQNDLDEIEANLAYLQRKWRLSVYNDINSIEGFKVEGFATTDRASLNELNNLIMKINTTITMLSSSGTNDPVFTARIQALNALKVKIQAIISDVESGARPESEIPISHNAYQNFLKSVNNTDSPVKDLALGSELPSTLSDLFPAYSSGDVSGANMARYIFQQYADTLFKGLSWDINLHYTSENQMNMANSLVNTLSSILPSKSYLSDVSDNRGEFASTISDLQNNLYSNLPTKPTPTPTTTTTTTNPTTTTTTNPTPTTTPSKSTKPVKFDWHERANFICESIQKREMNPDDFGCLKPDQYVSDNFSWRGYAKMICNRLATSYDTGLPEMCGCPESSWKGWRA